MINKNLDCETAVRIVDNATRLFSINGYAGTSIGEISKNSNLSRGILYHYFKDKDALYLYCAEQCVDKYLAFLEERTADLTYDKEALINALKMRFDFLGFHQECRAILHSVVLRRPNHLEKELESLYLKLHEGNLRINKRVTAHMEFGEGVMDVDILLFMAMMQNNAEYASINGKKINSPEMANAALRVTKIFINGLKEDIK